MEKLEDRTLMAVIPLASGEVVRFQDADGTEVKVKLIGPGEGMIELENGMLTGAAIDNLVLDGTTGQSKLKITTSGGTIAGTTINELVITQAFGELGALKHLKAKHVDFVDGGQLVATCGIGNVHIRSLGAGASIDIDGDVNRLKVPTVNADASIDVSGVVSRLVTDVLSAGSQLTASQLDMLKVKQTADDATIDIGIGGIAKAKFNHIYDSAVSSAGTVGRVVVKGEIKGTGVASNMDAGSDGIFGTIDDTVHDSSATGRIDSVSLRGQIGSVGDEKVSIVSSGSIGAVKIGRTAQQQNAAPEVVMDAMPQFVPLSIVQAAANATGFADDEIWIAVFGEEIPQPPPGGPAAMGKTYYLDATNLSGTNPKLTTTANLVPGPGTPNQPILPSYTLEQWKNATQAWGSNLAFPVPLKQNYQYTGRIIISAGAPVQAQVNPTNHTVSSPSAADPTDPSTGTFYDFLEFTVSSNTGTPSLDVDTSQVDSFGMPIGLQFFKDTAATEPYDIDFQGSTTANSMQITGITNLNDLVTTQQLGTGQPVTTTAGSGIQSGTVITSYDIDALTITLNKPVTAANMDVTFTAHAAGEVGVEAEREEILIGGTNDALFQFIQNKLAEGTAQARAFLEGAAPYKIAGPTPISFAAPIPPTITTASTTGLNDGDAVTIAGALGISALNGQFIAQNVTPTSYQIVGPLGNAAYTSGGTWTLPDGSSGTITGATNNTSPIVVATASTADLNINDIVTIAGVQGNTAANGTFVVVAKTSGSFTLGNPVGSGTYGGSGAWTSTGGSGSITAATNGAQIQVTADNTTGLADGYRVTIAGIQGMTGANGEFVIADVTATSFSLVDSTANSRYTANGTWAMTILDAATVSAIVVTADTTGLSVGHTATISGVLGNTSINGEFVVAVVTPTTFTLGSPIGNAAYTSGGAWLLPTATTTPILSGSTSGTMVIQTGNTFGLANGDTVLITDATGNPAVNGLQTVSDVTANSFTIASLTGNGNAVVGGAWQKVETITATSAAGQPIVLTTGSTEGVNKGGVISVTGVGGNTAANGMFVVADTTATTITLGSPAGSGAYTSGGSWTGSVTGSGTVTDATNGGAVEIVADSTLGLSDGDLVQIGGVGGNTAANGFYVVTGVGPTVFTLVDSLGNGTFTSGGTWSVNTRANRLVSPKDIVEALGSPQDPNGLNNYYNQIVDDFFLQYLPSSVTLPGGQVGGGREFSLSSSAFNGNSITYTGTVTNSGTQNGAYALQLSDPTMTDTTVYNVYYPWFTYNSGTDTNAPAPDIYIPLFPLVEAPSWVIANNWQAESASQMIFACDVFFADNVARSGIDVTGDAVKVLGDLEDSISAAFNRGIALNVPSSWSDINQWFPATGTHNYWTEYWHQSGLTFSDLAYAFPYDDKFGASTNLDISDVGLAKVTLGSWGTAGASTTAFQSFPASVAPAANLTLTAHVTGTSPTGTVTFFVNGIPVNTNDHSATPPLQPVALDGSGMATITALMPPLPTGTSPATYTVTAVYSGDGQNLPSIASQLLPVENPITLALAPGSGTLGTTVQMTVMVPGGDSGGSVEFSASRSDGSGKQVLGTQTVTSDTVVGNYAVPTDLLSFSGEILTLGNTISNVTNFVDLVGNPTTPVQTVTAAGYLPANAMITGFTPAQLTLSKPASGSGAVEFKSNGITFTGQLVSPTVVQGLMNIDGLSELDIITGNGVQAGTTISTLTPGSVMLNQTASNVTTGPIQFTSDGVGSAIPITATYISTTSVKTPTSQMFAVT